MSSELSGALVIVTSEEKQDSKKRKRVDDMQGHVSKRKWRSFEDRERPRKKARKLTNPTSSVETSWLRSGKGKDGHDGKTVNRIGRCSNNTAAKPSVENRKRKASDDGEAPERKMKCSKTSNSTTITESSVSPFSLTETNSPPRVKVRSVSTDGEDISHDFGNVSAEEESIFEMASRANTSRTDFKNKYCTVTALGSGGFGSVFGGVRESDFFPVAIKYIPTRMVHCKRVKCNGKTYNIIPEVFFMLKTGGLPGSEGQSAAVSLVDWYILGQELILVMEWPVLSKDLSRYLQARRGSLDEHTAKMILRQLVDAAIDFHSKGIFHRDIKLQNILCQFESGQPKVRVIDFGCGSFSAEEPFTSFFGTRIYAPPEWIDYRTYWAHPTTVWQLGIVFYLLLHRHEKFSIRSYINNDIHINRRLSTETKTLLDMCLAQDPGNRATLEELQRHPALRHLNPPHTQDHLQN